jgi:dihydropyrimidinase
LWDPKARRIVRWDDLHDNVGYTPYEGREVLGWPVMVFSRGRLVVSHGEFHGSPGYGSFVKRGSPKPIQDQRSARAAGSLKRAPYFRT